MPVASETGASYGDLDEQFMTARFCVTLTEPEFPRVSAYIKQRQATHAAVERDDHQLHRL